ncbi:fumarylacetoacetate hydrolase family protein [Ophiostoma piceae UAMH 11346]|uniref:Fumarylacetoacetate hydrolase family protein n=1 Tax=Ophiostoma piceae (strain UAMH 11346) TaxID=1262450 RepID=S3CNK3_OPHP1|nr:fumarylacetoacetate hydrolase family protein [Ophiostoma piceae UAMH 11346]
MVPDSTAALIGEPTDHTVDIGAALRKGASIQVTYKQQAQEIGMSIPEGPTVFLKPNTALAGPYPEPVILPKLTQADNCGDYESELGVVVGKTAKNVSEADALDYVLGYTACNGLQWCFSKGFDSACPIGPTLASKDAVPNPSAFRVRDLKNGKAVQDCGVDDLIFSVPKIMSFLSQSTTLLPGTLILTGTPAGVGMGKTPKESLQDGDEFSVEILPYVGTLTSIFRDE